MKWGKGITEKHWVLGNTYQEHILVEASKKWHLSWDLKDEKKLAPPKGNIWESGTNERTWRVRWKLQPFPCGSNVWEVSEEEIKHSCSVMCDSDPSDCSMPGSSVHGSFQARILEWAAMSSSRGSSRPRGRVGKILHYMKKGREDPALHEEGLGRSCIPMSCITGRLYCWAIVEGSLRNKGIC